MLRPEPGTVLTLCRVSEHSVTLRRSLGFPWLQFRGLGPHPLGTVTAGQGRPPPATTSWQSRHERWGVGQGPAPPNGRDPTAPAPTRLCLQNFPPSPGPHSAAGHPLAWVSADTSEPPTKRSPSWPLQSTAVLLGHPQSAPRIHPRRPLPGSLGQHLEGSLCPPLPAPSGGSPPGGHSAPSATQPQPVPPQGQCQVHTVVWEAAPGPPQLLSARPSSGPVPRGALHPGPLQAAPSHHRPHPVCSCSPSCPTPPVHRGSS